jgi:V8-like Glu-specific endopeptidase
MGDPWGTGFIVRGSDFGRGEELLLLTNEHVLSATHERALRVGNAYVTFETAPERGPAKCTEIVWSDDELDATLARFDAPLAGIEPIELDPTTDLPGRDDASRVYVIGHPNGGRLSFSLNDNLLLDYDDERMHYRAPTEPGSSGSPVFDDQWRLVALHHGGGDELPCLNGKDDVYEANEGFRIDRIRAAAGGA